MFKLKWIDKRVFNEKLFDNKKNKVWWKIKIDDILIFVKSCFVFYLDILLGIFIGE